MAEVFLAHKEGPGGARIECAVKRILPSHADTPERIAFFLQEMKLAATLQHRNIVRVHDLGDVDGVYFLELELVRGMDLKTLCDRLRERATKHPPRYPGQERGVLPPLVVASVGMQTCEGLQYAHTCRDHESDMSGVLHRDISNDNLMVTLDGEVKINDWGISKGLKGDKDILSKTNHAYGKLLYAPPEQLGGREIDARADLYALGISLFKLLARRG